MAVTPSFEIHPTRNFTLNDKIWRENTDALDKGGPESDASTLAGEIRRPGSL
jgi:hypothetical protein